MKNALPALGILLAATCSRGRPDETVATTRAALSMGPASSISAGELYTCAVLPTGAVACWGMGDAGELGNGSFSTSTTPVMVSGLSDAVAVSAGREHACALRATGGVVCWGAGWTGQLGDGTFRITDPPGVATPVAVLGLTDVVRLSAGDGFTCALRATGRVACWGEGRWGQLGDGSTSDSATPIAVAALDDVIDIAAGAQHACAVRDTGEVLCWGIGRLGSPDDTDGSTPRPPALVVGIADAVGVTAGRAHTCVTRATGEAACWGFGPQLGAPGTDSSETPVAVVGLDDVVTISAGDQYYGQGATCALRTSGQIACWGFGDSIQLGAGIDLDVNVGVAPVPVSGIGDATAVTTGYDHSCALRASGEVVCWGLAGQGQFAGPAILPNANTPRPVLNATDARSVALGLLNGCVVHTTGSVSCWGYGGQGALGNGSRTVTAPTPVSVIGIGDAVAVAASGHACVVRGSGRVACWGSGSEGELGNGSAADSSTPVEVSGIVDATDIGTGIGRTCVIRSTGQVACWGRDNGGPLSNNGSATPVAIVGLADAAAVGSGVNHTCALRRTGQVVCWGIGSQGQLGNGGTASSTTPVNVSDLSDAVALGVGWRGACAVRASGSVVCWGDGIPTPVAVGGINDATKVAKGQTHTCALRATGEVVCWGQGGWGQLGNGSYSASSTPVTVSGLADAVAIAAGSLGSCALRATGEVVCWGDNNYGELGNGTGGFSIVPVGLSAFSNNVGEPCAVPSDCFLGLCVDGVCCASACGGGTEDCQACSIAAGGAADGTCTPRPPATPCRAVQGTCDVEETCNGSSPDCPADGFLASGTECAAAATLCEIAGECGGGPICPGTTPIAGCTAQSAPACPGPCDVDLRGGTEVEDGVTVTFQEGITSPGDVSVTSCSPGSSPATGFKVVVGSSGQYCFDINTSAAVAWPPGSSIIVCIRYPAAIAANEASFQMQHDDGSGFMMNTVDSCLTTECVEDGSGRCTCANGLDGGTICGFAYSLSPFAIVEPIDADAPVFTDLPGMIVAYATSTAGAVVSYTPPTAIDDFDGPRPVDCAPASGTQFPPGKTTVTCAASDTFGNTNTASFAVWVQYQAPSDGSFFLKPIRADGSSVFRIGRPLPVKFKLEGASKNITDLQARLVVTKISDDCRGTTDDEGDEDGDEDDFLFKYRKGKAIYGYRWKTRDQTRGTYLLRAELGDDVVHEINVSLKVRR